MVLPCDAFVGRTDETNSLFFINIYETASALNK